MKSSQQIRLFLILIAVFVFCLIFIYFGQKNNASTVTIPSVSKETSIRANIAPDKPFTFGGLNIDEESISLSNPNEIPSVNLTFKYDGQKKSVWVDQYQSIKVFGYLIHIIRIDMAEGNIEFTIKKLTI